MVQLSPASVFQKVQAHQADNVTTCDVTIFATHTQFAIVQLFTNCNQKSQERRTLADRYIMKWCTAVQSQWVGWWLNPSIRDRYEIWDPSSVMCSQKWRFSGFSRSRCFLSLQSSPPISSPFSLSFPHQTLSFSKNWEIVGIWYFPSHPQLIYKLLLAPQVVVNQDMRALAAKRLVSKQQLLYSKYSVCLYFKCCHSMSSEIGLPVRDQTFQMSWF